MYISSAAKPVNQPDALRLLLDRILCGGDATLIAEGNAAWVLLDLAADCLSGRRIRVLRATDVLPSRSAMPMLSAHAAGRTKAGVPDDEALSRSFQALTVLDPSCDRIVLLVGDAHALSHSALRYIQFVSRSAAHLRLVFCGTQAFFDLLSIEEFTWLRSRLGAGLALTLAAPIPENWDAPPPSVPGDPAAWAGEAAAPRRGARSPAVTASKQPWPLLLGALSLLGLGGAAGLALGLRSGGADRPAAIQHAASVFVPPPAPPESPASVMPAAGAAPQADPGATSTVPDTPSPHTPGVADVAQALDPGSPSSLPVKPPSATAPGALVPNALVTVRSPSRASTAENEPRPPEQPPGSTRSLGRPGAPGTLSRVTATALSNRVRQLREAREQPASPSRDDQWVPPEPAFGSWTAPVRQPPRYIGSYTTDANGIRMFHLEPQQD